MVDTTKKILHKLRELGLEEKEALVYVAITELGQTTASKVARYTKLKRTTVYNLLPSLLTKGLIEKSLIRNISYFSVSSIKRLVKLAEERVELAKETAGSLEEIKSIRPRKSSVSVVQGIENLKHIYSEIIENTPNDSCIYAYYHTSGNNRMPDTDILQKQAKARILRKIPLRLICDSHTSLPTFAKNGAESLREVKFLTESKNKANGETIISQEKIIYISYTDDYLCTIIENTDIVAMERMVFEGLWERL